MACLEMYNNSSSNHHRDQYCPPPISPRISFSNDFVESSSSSQQLSEIRSRPKEQVSSSSSSDFEFSVTNYSMMSADELFFKGRLLPFKDACKNNQKTTTTLREELLAGDDEDGDGYGVSFKPPKSGSTRWKGFLGLKKSHIGSKKVEKGDGGTIVDNKRNEDNFHISNTTQEMVNDGGSNGGDDVEMGI